MRRGGSLFKRKTSRRRSNAKAFSVSPHTLAAAALLIVAFLFGGGGSGAGVANLVVQLTALAVIAFGREAFLEFFSDAPRPFAVLVGLTILLPLLQCVPLPPAIWHNLPGRELALESLSLVGRQDSWMPFSLNVRRTFIAFLALLPALTILVLTWRADGADRRVLLTVLVACGAAGIILGTQQLAFGNREFVFYAQAVGSPDLQGTFANRNTAGLFADIALCALIGLLWARRPSPTLLVVGAVITTLLLLGIFLTRSRSSMVLTFVPVLLFLLYLWNIRGAWLKSRSRFIGLFAGGAAVFLALVLLAGNARIERSLARFDTFQDARPAIWQDTKISISRFWPVGSGIGTFDEVFQLDESLENLSPGRAARAHNEYLETALESGIIGPLLLAAWTAIIGFATWRGIREAGEPGQRLAAAAVFTLLAFQSILDYPLRSQTLLCVAGLMLGLLIRRYPADAIARVGMR